MEIGYISKQSLRTFGSLLLPEAAGAIERGEPVTALGIFEDDTAAGAAAGYLDDGCFQIVSLYVAPEYRRKGGGRLLINTLSSLLKGISSGAMAANYTVSSPEHETLAPFLEHMGFERERQTGEGLFLFTPEQAAQSDFFGRSKGGSALPFSETPKFFLTKADEKARSLGVPMPPENLDSDAFDRDVSTAITDSGGVTAFLGVDRSCGGLLTVSCIFSEGSRKSAVPALLKESFRLIGQKYPPDTQMAVRAVNDSSARLVQTLLPGARPASMSFYKHADT